MARDDLRHRAHGRRASPTVRASPRPPGPSARPPTAIEVV